LSFCLEKNNDDKGIKKKVNELYQAV